MKALLTPVFAAVLCGTLACSATAAPPTAAVARPVAPAVIDDVWHDVRRDRDVPVRIYLPAGPGSFPAVIVSHGLGGSREMYGYIGRYLAEHGYIAVHVQHAGSDIALIRGARQGVMEALRAAILNPAVATERFRDVPFAIDQLIRLNDETGALRGRVDTEHFAILGHSFGAVTALAVAGQRFGAGAGESVFRDPRIDTAVALSPSPARNGRGAEEAFGAIAIPTLQMTGAEDVSRVDGLSAERRLEPFGGMSLGWRMLVVFDGADHMVFSGRPRPAPRAGDAAVQADVRTLSVDFLDAHLKGDVAARRRLETGGDRLLTAPGDVQVRW